MAWQLAQGRAGRQLGFIPEQEFCSCGEARGQRDEAGCRRGAEREAGRRFHTPVSTSTLPPALSSQFSELCALP